MKKITKSVVTSAMAVSLITQNIGAVLGSEINSVEHDRDEIDKSEVSKEETNSIVDMSNGLNELVDELLNGDVDYEGLANINTIKDGLKTIDDLKVSDAINIAKEKVNLSSISAMKEAIEKAQKVMNAAIIRLEQVTKDYESASQQVIDAENMLMELEEELSKLREKIDGMMDNETENYDNLEILKLEIDSLTSKIELIKVDIVKTENTMKSIEEEKSVLEKQIDTLDYNTLQEAKKDKAKIRDALDKLTIKEEQLKQADEVLKQALIDMATLLENTRDIVNVFLISIDDFRVEIEVLGDLSVEEMEYANIILQNDIEIALNSLVLLSGDSVVDELNKYYEIYLLDSQGYKLYKQEYDLAVLNYKEAYANYEMYKNMDFDTLFNEWLGNQDTAEVLKEALDSKYLELLQKAGIAIKFRYFDKEYAITYEQLLINSNIGIPGRDKINLLDLINKKLNVNEVKVCKHIEPYGARELCKNKVDELNILVNKGQIKILDDYDLQTYFDLEQLYQEAVKRDKEIGNAEGLGDNVESRNYYKKEFYNNELARLEGLLIENEQEYKNTLGDYLKSNVAHTVTATLDELLLKLDIDEGNLEDILLSKIINRINENNYIRGSIGELFIDFDTVVRQLEEEMISVHEYLNELNEYRIIVSKLTDELLILMREIIDGDVKEYSIEQIKELLENRMISAVKAIEVFESYNSLVTNMDEVIDIYSKQVLEVESLEGKYKELSSLYELLNLKFEDIVSNKAELKGIYDLVSHTKKDTEIMIDKAKKELSELELRFMTTNNDIQENQRKLNEAIKIYTDKQNESLKPTPGGSNSSRPKKDKEETIDVEGPVIQDKSIDNPYITSITDESLRKYLEDLVSIEEMNVYSNFGLKVYGNSRVTSIEKKSNGFKVNGYMWIDGVTPTKDIWRELILVNTENMATQYSYRKQGLFDKMEWLNQNLIATQNGKLDLTYAGYSVDVNYNDLNSYISNQSGTKIVPGKYQMFIRISDGINSFLFPLVDRVLSDGSTMEFKGTLPEGFIVMQDDVRSLVVEVK